MLIIGEWRCLESTHSGSMLTLEHLPDMPIFVPDELHARIQKRFGMHFRHWKECEGSHLLLIGTISRWPQGGLQLESVSLVNTTEHWLPFDGIDECKAVRHVVAQERRFIKCLRYNLHWSQPSACIVLNDTPPMPTAIYVIPNGTTYKFDDDLAALIEISKMPALCWHADWEPIPALPGPTLL
jgi:hypothetical protein